MLFRIYGSRGSYPISGQDYSLFGGHTTCFYMRSRGGAHLTVDAGTGIRQLGHHLMREGFERGNGEMALFFTHTHWDHIMGLPFFNPLFIEGNVFNLFTASLPYSGIQAIFSGLFKPDIFPVPFDDLKSVIKLQEIIPPVTVDYKDFSVRAMQINHNNISLGYRVENEGKSVTVLTDNAIIELARMGDGFPDEYIRDENGKKTKELSQKTLDFISEYRTRQAEFARGTDILVCDTHFTVDTIVGRETWGHSTPDEAIRLAHECQPGMIILHHHDPERHDSHVLEKEEKVRKALDGTGIKVFAGYEGFEMEL
ncbi:MBL fold metallo-hydrolase [Myxococcota bacterium]|nr:MBL fold metallo-hydrolase [Myxococcota bacterium]MBU1380848.1 MBL fold metallo-hydrolase [Myxococcota bacterium]MBU1499145.1 MBL fold metallo-hydrolase [Myxococcota bacterium]